VPIKCIKLDVANPRLAGTDLSGLKDTKTSQDKIIDYLQEKALSLNKAIEFNGGLAEPLIGQA
jgi:hypothetical protein